MSVDLLLDTVRPIHVRAITSKISKVLAELLGLITAPPALSVWEMEDGIQLVAKNDEIGTVDSQMLLISVVGEQEFVSVVGNAEYVSVSVSGGRRSALQYALAAATAITLAREFDAGINDAGRVYGDRVDTTPERILKHLRVAGQNDNYHDAASAIRWGPGM